MATTVEAAFSDENERDAKSESSKPTGTLLAISTIKHSRMLLLRNIL